MPLGVQGWELSAPLHFHLLMWVAPVGGRNTGELRLPTKFSPRTASVEALKSQRGKAAALSWTSLIMLPFLPLPSTGSQNLLMTGREALTMTRWASCLSSPSLFSYKQHGHIYNDLQVYCIVHSFSWTNTLLGIYCG